MNNNQTYKKKKNVLIMLFMILLVVFIGLMCYIFIYSKLNPPKEFISPDEIEILKMSVANYTVSSQPTYNVVENFEEFGVIENGEVLNLKITNENKIKVLKNELEEEIKITSEDIEINNNIKTIYQNDKVSLILNNEGSLYKLITNNLEDGTLKVEQILSNIKVKDIVNINIQTDRFYVLSNDDKLINIYNEKEYDGIVKEVKTATSVIYIYEKNYFGVEEGKIFVNEYNQPIEINISFDNKIISKDNVIYEINSQDNSLSTSRLGIFEKVWYSYKENTQMYDIAVLSNTGLNEFKSTYYYTK